MTSTYASYRVYSQDLAGLTARTASRRDVSADVKYYQDNIGKVTSVDQLLNDRRLFSVAMKAHGLSDMVYAKAFMRKVLESDISDQSSFVNRLADKRYVEFVKSFNFTTSGELQENLSYAQNEFQQDDTVDLYSDHRIKQSVAVASEAKYYEDKIGTVASADELLGNSRLFAFALKSVGLDPTVASKPFIRDMLTSDLSDPGSPANQVSNVRYRDLAASFSFDTSGNVLPGGTAQSDAQKDATIYAYYGQTARGVTPAAAAYNGRYYEAQINTLGSVDDLLANDRLFSYALTAHGIDPVIASKTLLRQVFTSDLSDPGSVANSIADPRYRTLAAAFNFATDGSITAGNTVQSQSQLDGTTSRYLVTYDDAAEASESLAMAVYRSRMNAVSTVDELLSNPGLYTFALQAFGLDPETESKAKIRQVLVSDVSQPGSFARLQADPRYRELAAAFNFGPDGTALQPREAQSETEELETIRRYTAALTATASDAVTARNEGAYYHNMISRVRSVDDFLADKRLLSYTLKAYGLEADRLTTETLKTALTSDPLDKASFVNKQGSDLRLRDLAAAYNFRADGSIGRSPAQIAQSRSDVLETADGYTRQTMESDAGQQNEGVRLSLYFQRKASTITSATGILADKAFLKVVQTALGLPAQLSQSSIEVQAAVIQKRLNVADLQDPQKVEKLLARFGAMYDIENGTAAASSPAAVILGASSGTTIGTDFGLLAALQRIRF